MTSEDVALSVLNFAVLQTHKIYVVEHVRKWVSDTCEKSKSLKLRKTAVLITFCQRRFPKGGFCWRGIGLCTAQARREVNKLHKYIAFLAVWLMGKVKYEWFLTWINKCLKSRQCRYTDWNHDLRSKQEVIQYECTIIST